MLGDRHHGGVVLVRPDQLITKVTREFRGKPNARGADPRGMVYDPIEGTLDVEILPNPAGNMTLVEVWREWKSSWSTTEPGTLILITGTHRWELEMVAKQLPSIPEQSPASRLAKRTTSAVEVLGLDGLWSGQRRELTGQNFRLANTGSVTMFPEAIWSGVARTVTLPDGRIITLPTVTGQHKVILDPGLGFPVVGPNGQQSTPVWAAFRGLDLSAPIRAGEIVTMSCTGGARVAATPLHENPWE